jgi:hypothetical protein
MHKFNDFFHATAPGCIPSDCTKNCIQSLSVMPLFWGYLPWSCESAEVLYICSEEITHLSQNQRDFPNLASIKSLAGYFCWGQDLLLLLNIMRQKVTVGFCLLAATYITPG